MLDVDEALRAVLERTVPPRPRRRPLLEALGCLLAEDVTADIDLPPFDKALVDGYAVRAADLQHEGPHRLVLGEEITAGRVPTRRLAAGEAAAIMTGAPLPAGADAVVMIEDTRLEERVVVVASGPVTPGRNRLCRGRELHAGEVVLRRGARLNPARLGVLAAVGRVEAAVAPRPRVAVVSTGDELVEPGRVPGPGQIRNSNAVMLTALALGEGAEAEAAPIVRDEPEALAEALRRGLAADLLAITGGVSAGTRDLVPEALERLGVTRVFHKVRLRPGKPLWFGIGPKRGDDPGTLVFGLPGNPVSGLVGFLLFVRPALRILAGETAADHRMARLPLGRDFVHTGERSTYHPSQRIATASGTVLEPLEWAGSADLRTVAGADGFAVFPAGARRYGAGEVVDFLPLG